MGAELCFRFETIIFKEIDACPNTKFHPRPGHRSEEIKAIYAAASPGRRGIRTESRIYTPG
jgi:hypothetical protein